MLRIKNIVLIFIFLSAGCASGPLQKARNDFYSGDLSRADNVLGECTDTSERDRLLCYMEKGLILHYMEEIEKSTRVLLEASRFIKEQDQVSIKDQSTSVLINDKTATYKGEYCEKLWVHTFLMMNFLLQYRYDSALVEAKQALEVYDAHPESLERDYFTRALIALCFENMKLPDDARIEYEKLSKSMGGEFIMPEPVTPGKGELVLFIAQGRVPQKISADIVLPPSIRISVPRYASSYSPRPAIVRAGDRVISSGEIITDMGDVARKSLDDRAARFLTRQAVRAGTKEIIAQEIGEKSEIGEALTRIILFLLEEADTRSWETLPGNIELVRIILDAGTHNLEISSGNSKTVYLNDIDVPEGRRVYQSVRF